MKELYAKIPNMNEILLNLQIDDLDINWQKKIANDYLEKLRSDIGKGLIKSFDTDELISNIKSYIIEHTQSRLKPLINASGVVIHTNLGRAIIHKDLLDKSIQNLSEYSNLEFDLKTGKRGSRYDLVTDRLCLLSGAEDALIVNNNASAVMLILAALCKDKEVIVSRGELVEIGGSFRVPEVMKLSGCDLVEVGTTNKTHAFDYEDAITENTGMLLKVHTSNYKILGFTDEVDTKTLSEISNRFKVPLYEDLGSGSFELGIKGENKTIEEVVRQVDMVSFSGDKLLGGPQCGIILGKKKYLDVLKRHQLLRALRVDKFTLSILDQMISTFFQNASQRRVLNKTRYYLMRSRLDVKADVTAFLDAYVNDLDDQKIRLIPLQLVSEIGAGSLPTETLDSYGLKISMKLKPDMGLNVLRSLDKPIIARIEDDHIILDFRTIEQSHFKSLFDGLKKLEALN